MKILQWRLLMVITNASGRKEYISIERREKKNLICFFIVS